MGSTRRSVLTLASVVVLGATTLGAASALAQTDGPPEGRDPQALLERLDALEPELPGAPPPQEVGLAADTTWGSLEGDASSARAMLDTLEPELRALFVDADDADGDVADAVALVTRGWLDVWTGTASIGAAESHDLAFPLEATDELGVTAGADELRGELEVGLELVLEGRARHLDGYLALRELDEAEPESQARFDERAAAAEEYDAQVRPRIAIMLSGPTVTVAVPRDRFETDAPGVQSRATSMTVVCVDREALEELGGVATDEVLAELGVVDRADCPQLPEPLEEPVDVDGELEPAEPADPEADEAEVELEAELELEADIELEGEADLDAELDTELEAELDDPDDEDSF